MPGERQYYPISSIFDDLDLPLSYTPENRELTDKFFDVRYEIGDDYKARAKGGSLDYLTQGDYTKNTGAIQLFDVNKKRISDAYGATSIGPIYDINNNRSTFGHTEPNLIRYLLDGIMKPGFQEFGVTRPSEIKVQNTRYEDYLIAEEILNNSHHYKDVLRRHKRLPDDPDNMVKLWTDKRRCTNCKQYVDRVLPKDSQIGYLSKTNNQLEALSKKFAEEYADNFRRMNERAPQQLASPPNYPAGSTPPDQPKLKRAFDDNANSENDKHVEKKARHHDASPIAINDGEADAAFNAINMPTITNISGNENREKKVKLNSGARTAQSPYVSPVGLPLNTLPPVASPALPTAQLPYSPIRSPVGSPVRSPSSEESFFEKSDENFSPYVSPVRSPVGSPVRSPSPVLLTHGQYSQAMLKEKEKKNRTTPTNLFNFSPDLSKPISPARSLVNPNSDILSYGTALNTANKPSPALVHTSFPVKSKEKKSIADIWALELEPPQPGDEVWRPKSQREKSKEKKSIVDIWAVEPEPIQPGDKVWKPKSQGEKKRDSEFNWNAENVFDQPNNEDGKLIWMMKSIRKKKK